MKQILSTLFTFVGSLLMLGASAGIQGEWPRVISSADGAQIKIYEPQAESRQGNQLKARSAVSVLENGKEEPSFGTIWMVITLTEQSSSISGISSVKVPNLKFPGDISTSRINYLKTTLETQLPKLDISFSNEKLESALNKTTEQNKLSKELSNKAPNVLYVNRPSILVLIDGAPKLERNDEWGVDVVVNSPYAIVKNSDNRFYLYGGKRWYVATAATGPYSHSANPPAKLDKIQKAIEEDEDSKAGYSDADDSEEADPGIADIIVSTESTELIQTKGEPQFTPITGTELLYVSNSSNDIFMDATSQKYFVLLSGRWYTASSLKGNWTYVSSSSLPEDFAKIPEGSPKDNVLASIAGTDAAREAVMDAQVPQTAKVDRQKATAEVNYDGDPRFENINGTRLEYAINTSATVIRLRNRYYAVDNGIWFESRSANGPWIVATERPDEVDLIPPSYPVYNVKYVYIYDITPDYVYMGYTPGYLNTYIYGPTVVYGTGYYYRPWYGRYYYPRPCTWGFNMWYNPWAGWSIGLNFNVGWFNTGFYHRPWNHWHGGWWGPSVYRPPFAGHYYPRNGHGFYGYNSRSRTTIINVNHTTNIYRNRRDVVTRDNGRYNGRYNHIDRNGNSYGGRYPDRNRPGGSNGVSRPGTTRPGTGGITRPGSNRPGEGRPGNGSTRPGNGRPDNGGVRPGTGRPDNVDRRPGWERPGTTRPGRPDYGDVRPGTGRPDNGGMRPERPTTRPATPDRNPSGRPSGEHRPTPRPVQGGSHNGGNRVQQPSRTYDPGRGAAQRSSAGRHESGSRGNTNEGRQRGNR